MKYLKFLFLMYGFVFLNTSLYSQNIKVYFTKSVDNSASLLTNAQFSAHLEDTIIALIDETNTTLDMAVWDNGSSAIVSALNNAYSRGVTVRYITSDNAFNSALSGLNSNIPVLYRDATATSNVMHNKFIISDNSILLTGSMNFGLGSMEDDYNNIVIINDASLALNYLTEFNEMWGSTGPTFNLTNSKFGVDKTDNTIHSFTIGTSGVESYFSPTDQTTSHIISSISSADYTCFVSMFTLTHNDIADALIAAHANGVDVKVIMENESYIGSEFNNLQSAGIPIISHESLPFDYHHKYAVIDSDYPASDPQVITGSHNWTNSAEEEYDENTLIIHDAVVAGNYLEEFMQRWNENTTSSNMFDHLSVYIPRFYYSFGSEYIVLNSIFFNDKKVNWTISDMNGKVIKSGKSDFSDQIYVGNIKQGYYLFILEGGGIFETHNMVFIR